MEIEILGDPGEVARRGAAFVAAEARAAVRVRGAFTLAVSGGSTPWQMLRVLAAEDVPWDALHLFQVDERVAPSGHPNRNLTHLRESFLARLPLPGAHLHAMPVEAPELEAAAAGYARTLAEAAGRPPVLDLVHLGLSPDGHTASLVPGDPVLSVADSDVAVTARPYQGRRRMTLTYPLLERARQILWLVTGASKSAMLARLRTGDTSIPGGRVRRDRALVLADRAAAGCEPAGRAAHLDEDDRNLPPPPGTAASGTTRSARVTSFQAWSAGEFLRFSRWGNCISVVVSDPSDECRLDRPPSGPSPESPRELPGDPSPHGGQVVFGL